MGENTLVDDDGIEVFYRTWVPDSPKGIVLVLHGMSEHSGRYRRFAEALAGAGYAVYADDHRGFGHTAASTGPGLAGPRGFDGVLDSIHAVQERALHDVGELPVVVFGHSMGSMFAQVYAQEHASELAGVVLCGTSGPMPELEEMVTGLKAAVDGGAGDAPLDMLGSFNAAFEPSRTPYDWLSRDEAEVDAYIADPMAGDAAPVTLGYAYGVLELLTKGSDPERLALLPKGLPVLLITGMADPVSNGGATVKELEARYLDQELDVSSYYYPEARHELLNEINRDDVQRDVIGWLDGVIDKA
jgi:alpha-beta hydrolase superfamily lysophospholipase